MDLFAEVHGTMSVLLAVYAIFRFLQAVATGVVRGGMTFERKFMPMGYYLYLLFYVVMAIVTSAWAYHDAAKLFGWPPLPPLPLVNR